MEKENKELFQKALSEMSMPMPLQSINHHISLIVGYYQKDEIKSYLIMDTAQDMPFSIMTKENLNYFKNISSVVFIAVNSKA